MKLQNWTRPFAELTFPPSATHYVLKIATFRAPAIYPDFTEYCACHKKWHSKITKYCACHEKWRSKITKCCASHEKWHSKITKYCPCHEKWIETLRSCYFTELVLYWAGTLLYWTVTLLNCYFTEPVLYWAGTNVTKYCTCHVEWLSWLMSVTYETSFTMRGETGVIHQRHQVLRLPRKMTLMTDVRHIWNVIYNARSNRCHTPTSQSTAPAT